jgi:tetratricopeptide (TPR) repeat protein
MFDATLDATSVSPDRVSPDRDLADPAQTSAWHFDLGRQAVKRGDLVCALEHYVAALAAARLTDNVDLVDTAEISRAAVAISIGPRADEASCLRTILARHHNTDNGWLAAYTLARLYELEKEHKKGLFYARMASDRARWIDRADVRGSSANQLGNAYLAENLLDQARCAYSEALELFPAGDEVWSARILDNLGYCLVLEGKLEDGMRLLYRSLRTLRRHKAYRYAISSHIDLAFALQEAGRLPAARRHAQVALGLADHYGDFDALKNGLYLLGEVYFQLDDVERATATFGLLERRFFPNNPGLARRLLAVDVAQLVHLRRA